MFGGTLATDSALGEWNKCVSTGLDMTNPHFGGVAKKNPTHVAEYCQSSWSKRILGLRKFDWTSFSFSKTFHLLSKRLLPFYINCWELLLLRVYCQSRTKVCLWVSCCKKFWGCKKHIIASAINHPPRYTFCYIFVSLEWVDSVSLQAFFKHRFSYHFGYFVMCLNCRILWE